MVPTTYASATMPGNNNCFEINRYTVVASVVCGFGSRKLINFCGYLDIPGLNVKTFHVLFDTMCELTPQIITSVV